MNDSDPTEDLATRSSDFSEAMRWKDFNGASRFISATVKDQFIEKFIEDDSLHVVDSSINKVDIDVDQEHADVEYVMEYYHLPSSRVLKWTWNQQWILTKGKENTWQIDNAPPKLPWED
jgi:hypothetical protein